MIHILIEAEREFDKVKLFSWLKTCNNLGIEGNYLNIIKAINDKPTGNIIFNGRRRKSFLLRSNEEECLLSPLLFIIVLEVLARVTRQEKEKSIQIRKEAENYLFADDLILYVESHKDPPPKREKKKPLELINEFSKVVGYKVNAKICCISFFFFSFLGPHPWQMEVARLGVE